jgi:2-polyprenyl-3-methyl-5-hydroxy-6-metoxy-1,4-benzoquinol methylase
MGSTTSEPKETGRELQDAGGLWPAADARPARADEDLHYGRAWHRYRFCYRSETPLRVLDAGCGTGHTSAWLAKLNPTARVLGVDPSLATLHLARRQTDAAGVGHAVSFLQHHLDEPIPNACGPFDFVVCRSTIGRAADPTRLLANLVQVLDPAGLLMIALPSRAGRQVARALQHAVDALATPGATSDVRLGLAREVYQALLPDHPIRTALDDSTPDALERRLAGCLDDRHDWTLGDAAAMIECAGLKFLYAATPWRWRPDRVFAPDSLPDHLRAGIDRLAPDRLSHLIDALDPTLLADEFQLYACPASYAPPLPSWLRTRLDDPATFDRLVPELTGLGRVETSGASSIPGGRVSYQTISGTPGELDRMSALLLSSVDGKATCGMIEETYSSRMRAGDDLAARQGRWIDLADAGLVVLRPQTA